MRELELIESGEKIRLILVRIDSFEQVKKTMLLLYSCIVSHRNLIESVFECLLEKTVELHQIIAEDIRIRCEPLLISSIDIAYDSFLVFFPEIEGMERKPEVRSHFFCLLHIDKRRTILGIRDIVDHESARYLMPCLTQEVGDNSGIYSARESYEDFRHENLW